MPVETIIQGPTTIRALPDGSRDIVALAGPNHAYAIRIPGEAVTELVKAIQMDEDEMQDAQARQHAASKIVVPSTVAPRNDRPA